jgi:transcriptional regulator with XRE-family HTH domain
MKKKGITPTALHNATGISTGNISDWKSGRSKPSNNKLLLIANFLGVSVDYLLGNEQKNKSSSEKENLSPEAVKLAKKIGRLSPANHAKLDELIDLFLSSQGKKK